MIPTLLRMIAWLVGSALAGAFGLVLWAAARGSPEDLPWTPLDLGQPSGLFTGRKLTALTATISLSAPPATGTSSASSSRPRTAPNISTSSLMSEG